VAKICHVIRIKLNQLVWENVRIIPILLREWCPNKKHFAELDLQRGGKTAGIDMVWRNYVTVTLCILLNDTTTAISITQLQAQTKFSPKTLLPSPTGPVLAGDWRPSSKSTSFKIPRLINSSLLLRVDICLSTTTKMHHQNSNESTYRLPALQKKHITMVKNTNANQICEACVPTITFCGRIPAKCNYLTKFIYR